nr:PREDICTED: RB1-inducible coiled-coil protein 1-like [Bemisia tabaci]
MPTISDPLSQLITRNELNEVDAKLSTEQSMFHVLITDLSDRVRENKFEIGKFDSQFRVHDDRFEHQKNKIEMLKSRINEVETTSIKTIQDVLDHLTARVSSLETQTSTGLDFFRSKLEELEARVIPMENLPERFEESERKLSSLLAPLTPQIEDIRKQLGPLELLPSRVDEHEQKLTRCEETTREQLEEIKTKLVAYDQTIPARIEASEKKLTSVLETHTNLEELKQTLDKYKGINVVLSKTEYLEGVHHRQSEYLSQHANKIRDLEGKIFSLRDGYKVLDELILGQSDRIYSLEMEQPKQLVELESKMNTRLQTLEDDQPRLVDVERKVEELTSVKTGSSSSLINDSKTPSEEEEGGGGVIEPLASSDTPASPTGEVEPGEIVEESSSTTPSLINDSKTPSEEEGVIEPVTSSDTPASPKGEEKNDSVLVHSPADADDDDASGTMEINNLKLKETVNKLDETLKNLIVETARSDSSQTPALDSRKRGAEVGERENKRRRRR